MGSMGPATFLTRIRSTPYEVHRLAESMPYFPIPARKVLLDLCRIQLPVQGNRHLRIAFQAQLDVTHYIPVQHKMTSMTLYEVINTWLVPVIHRPAILAITSQIIRMSPFINSDTVIEEIITGVEKELGPTQRLRRAQRINYASIFGEEDFDGSIADGIPEAPETTNEIRRRLRSWKMQISGTVLLPKYNRIKNISAGSSGRYNREVGAPLHNYVTSLDLERHYHHTGSIIGGPCEVRVAWKYTDLKPRVYYAQGGHAFHHSKFVQRIFNSLSEVIETTNVAYRFQSNRLNPISHDDTLMIYDYSNFTSEFDEQTHFLYELATFLDDVEVIIVDTHRGPKPASLGQLIREYAAECNDNPEFDTGGVYGDREYWHHRVAGMLGVYGNIVSCTILHGVILAIIADSIDACNCVGDDAEVKWNEATISLDNMETAISLGGSVAKEKFRIWRYKPIEDGGGEGWKYLKRPIDRLGESVVTGYLIDLPGLDIILDLHDEFHRTDDRSVNIRQKTIVRQTCRVLDLVFASPAIFTEEDRIFVLEFLQEGFRHMKIPRGAFPRPDGFPLMTPLLTMDAFDQEWKEAVIGQGVPEIMLRPEYAEDADEQESWVWSIGTEFSNRGSGMLTLLEDLGYVDKEVKRIAVRSTDLEVEKFMLFLGGGLHRLYHYRVLDIPPSWLQ